MAWHPSAGQGGVVGGTPVAGGTLQGGEIMASVAGEFFGSELRRKTQGTSIGLSLVKAVAKSHGRESLPPQRIQRVREGGCMMMASAQWVVNVMLEFFRRSSSMRAS